MLPSCNAPPTALKREEQPRLSPTEKLEQLPWQKTDAKARGYEGEMCGECGNFTLVRNGTCMKPVGWISEA